MIGYESRNLNPKNKVTFDCVIRALTAASGKEYTQVLRELVELEIETGYHITDKKCYERWLTRNGFIKHPQPRRPDGTKYKVKDLDEVLGDEHACKQDSAAPVVVLTTHHAAAILAGTVVDIWDIRHRTAYNYYTGPTITPTPEPEPEQEPKGGTAMKAPSKTVFHVKGFPGLKRASDHDYHYAVVATWKDKDGTTKHSIEGCRRDRKDAESWLHYLQGVNPGSETIFEIAEMYDATAEIAAAKAAKKTPKPEPIPAPAAPAPAPQPIPQEPTTGMNKPRLMVGTELQRYTGNGWTKIPSRENEEPQDLYDRLIKRHDKVRIYYETTTTPGARRPYAIVR